MAGSSVQEGCLGEELLEEVTSADQRRPMTVETKYIIEPDIIIPLLKVQFHPDLLQLLLLLSLHPVRGGPDPLQRERGVRLASNPMHLRLEVPEGGATY